jgi:hypothetical protein
MKTRKESPFPIGDPRSPRICHLLIVAGPSGSGKTTFLAKLAAGELSPDVAAELPAGSKDWMQTNGLKIVRNARRCTGNRAGLLAGLVLHYDIMRPWESRIGDYPRDRALRLLALAERVTLIELRPDAETLAVQLTARARGGQTAEEWTSRLQKRAGAALKSLRSRTLAGARKLLGRDGCPPKPPAGFSQKPRHATLVMRYAEPGWVDAWYVAFERYVRSTVGSAVTVRVVRAEPVLTADRRASFRLLADA